MWRLWFRVGQEFLANTSNAGCQFLFTTVLREPEERFWSNYFYQVSLDWRVFHVAETLADCVLAY